MLSMEQLEKMKDAVIDANDISTLPDISNVSIHGDTPSERLESFIEQIGNPYVFKVGTTPVRLSFNNDGKPLEEVLKSHFLGLKQKS